MDILQFRQPKQSELLHSTQCLLPVPSRWFEQHTTVDPRFSTPVQTARFVEDCCLVSSYFIKITIKQYFNHYVFSCFTSFSYFCLTKIHQLHTSQPPKKQRISHPKPNTFPSSEAACRWSPGGQWPGLQRDLGLGESLEIGALRGAALKQQGAKEKRIAPSSWLTAVASRVPAAYEIEDNCVLDALMLTQSDPFGVCESNPWSPQMWSRWT